MSKYKSSIQHKEKAMNKRQSVKPTYDSRTDGLQYTISTSVNGRAIGDYKDITDPFVNHKVRVSWKDTLKGLLRGGVVVSVMVSGKNRRIEEDVLELNDNYLSLNSTRRYDFNNRIVSQIDEHMNRAKQAHSAITKLIESAVIEFADKCIKELELFTAGHDRAMRDEAIDIIKAELQAQAKKGK